MKPKVFIPIIAMVSVLLMFILDALGVQQSWLAVFAGGIAITSVSIISKAKADAAKDAAKAKAGAETDNAQKAAAPDAPHDVFISYRRDGGEMAAMLIYQALTERGYNVFSDVEVLNAGRFNEALLQNIRACKDFLLVLSPGALDRCNDPEDWVRQEIAEAIRDEKNIVPIMMKGFAFPETLPPEIEAIRYYHGLTPQREFFRESIDRLCGKYLQSTPVK